MVFLILFARKVGGETFKGQLGLRQRPSWCDPDTGKVRSTVVLLLNSV